MENQLKKESIITVIKLVIAGCLIYSISSGIRGNYGILLNSISENSGVSYSSVSFSIAVAQLVFGIMQPVFGVVAIKKSNRFVVCSGVILMILGLMVIPICKSAWTLMIFLGIILPSGTGAFSFGIIMSAITPKVSQNIAATVSGFVNASCGIGSTIFSPIIQSALESTGIKGTMLILSISVFILLPISIWLCKSDNKTISTENIDINKTEKENTSLKTILLEALKNRTYKFLMIGFFTCGFHMAIIETHFYTQITTYNITEQMAAYIFSIYGIATIIGAIVSGIFCSKFQMQKVLGTLFASRTFIIIFFLTMPKTIITIVFTAIFLGLTGASTITPTSGIVSKVFGVEKLAMLFGFVFFCHQIGSFFSAWIGGISVMTTGGYTLIWGASALLSLLAAIVSFLIKDEKKVQE